MELHGGGTSRARLKLSPARSSRLSSRAMNCIVTAGPTYESLDAVRRLTNFSTGKLGTQLANFLADRGHDVTLLIGYYATHHEAVRAKTVTTYTTTTDLRDRLHALSGGKIDAVFHAAAVSDFQFGKIWERNDAGALTELTGGKLSTRAGTLLAELVPTPKILAGLRTLYPHACLVGWKYEVDGDQTSVISKARQQLADCHTDACVANGKAYGPGFGVVTGDKVTHFGDVADLYVALENLLQRGRMNP